MKKAIMIIVVMTACMLLVVAGAFAAGNVDKGKALFNDSKFGGQKTCGSCHPNGKGLEKAGSKKEFTVMGKKQASLEDAINFCIENALKGKAIKKDSADMMDMVAYIKSVGMAPTATAPATAPAAPAPAKKATGGY